MDLDQFETDPDIAKRLMETQTHTSENILFDSQKAKKTLMQLQKEGDNVNQSDAERQFQFFKIENALQKCCENLIEPMKKRVMEVEGKNAKTMDVISKLKASFSTNTASIIDLKQRITEIGTCMRQIQGVEQKLKSTEKTFQSQFEKMETHMEDLNSNVKSLEMIFDVEMVVVKQCEIDYKASLKHIDETKEKVWQYIMRENEKQSNAILNIENPIEQFRSEILQNASTVKCLQEVIRQESAKNAVLLSRMQALEEDIAQLQEIKVSKISLQASNDFIDNKINQIRFAHHETDQVLRKAVDFIVGQQPKKVRNQIYDVLCGFMKPIQQRDLFNFNQTCQQVENAINTTNLNTINWDEIAEQISSDWQGIQQQLQQTAEAFVSAESVHQQQKSCHPSQPSLFQPTGSQKNDLHIASESMIKKQSEAEHQQFSQLSTTRIQAPQNMRIINAASKESGVHGAYQQQDYLIEPSLTIEAQEIVKPQRLPRRLKKPKKQKEKKVEEPVCLKEEPVAQKRSSLNKEPSELITELQQQLQQAKLQSMLNIAEPAPQSQDSSATSYPAYALASPALEINSNAAALYAAITFQSALPSQHTTQLQQISQQSVESMHTSKQPSQMSNQKQSKQFSIQHQSKQLQQSQKSKFPSSDSIETYLIQQSEDSQDQEVYEQFGIDLTRFVKLEVFDEKLQDMKDKQKIDLKSLQDQIEGLKGALNHVTNEFSRFRLELQSQQQLNRTALIEQVKTSVKEVNAPIIRDMENLMTARNRQKSDDMLKLEKIISRFSQMEEEIQGHKEFLDSCIAPLITCLLEIQSIQTSLDDQDDQDKQKIALYGRRTTEYIPQGINLNENSVSREPSPRKDFNQSVKIIDVTGQSSKVTQVNSSTFEHKTNWQKKTNPNEIITIDQKCLNCSSDVQQVTKLFKVACLAFQPGEVDYRGHNFNRQQLFVLRKFLIGQSSQFINQSKKMKQLSLCTRRIFDDIHLYIQKIGRWENITKLAFEQFNLIEHLHDQNEIIRPLLSSRGEDSIFVDQSPGQLFQPKFTDTKIIVSKGVKKEETVQKFWSSKTSRHQDFDSTLSPELQRAILTPATKLPATARVTDRDMRQINRTTLAQPVIGCWLGTSQRGYTASTKAQENERAIINQKLQTIQAPMTGFGNRNAPKFDLPGIRKRQESVGH